MRLTNDDVERITKEIEERKYELRPKLVESLKEARAQGDLSENFEYYVAKRDNNRNNSRIRYLEKLLKTSTIIKENNNRDQIGVGDKVTIEYEEDGFQDEYIIVSTFAADSLNNMLSVESPVGKAIVGHRVGDRCSFMVNDETSYVNIISLEKRKK